MLESRSHAGRNIPRILRVTSLFLVPNLPLHLPLPLCVLLALRKYAFVYIVSFIFAHVLSNELAMCNFKATFDLWTMELRAGTEMKRWGEGGECLPPTSAEVMMTLGRASPLRRARNVQRKFIFTKRSWK